MKWYCQPNESIDYTVEITEAVTEHSNENITKNLHNFTIKQDHIQYFWFNFKPIYIDDSLKTKLSNVISFNENMIEFSPCILKDSEFRKNMKENWAYILYWKTSFASDIILKAKYLNKGSEIQLKVQNVSLNEKDIE